MCFQGILYTLGFRRLSISLLSPVPCYLAVAVDDQPIMPSATGENWEKYNKNYADEEEPEKKVAPLTDEYV